MNDFNEKNAEIVTFGAGPLVAILMGTMNGQQFLAEQLDSLELQTHQNWVLIASDDGSTDDTLEILQSYQAKWPNGKLIIKEGPKQGFCANFLSMACDPAIRADYYAFCDQDDVWITGKLAAAIAKLQVEPSNLPKLYCGRSIYTNSEGNPIGCSTLFMHLMSFRNALVQSVAGANTMLFNLQTKTLFEQASPCSPASHDWWAYLLISGVGGEIVYDPTPWVHYRQHPKSLVGENRSILAKLNRVKMIFNGQFKLMVDLNVRSLKLHVDLLKLENVKLLKLFCMMRDKDFNDRLRLFEVCGLYRQSWQGTISLFIALLLKRI